MLKITQRVLLINLDYNAVTPQSLKCEWHMNNTAKNITKTIRFDYIKFLGKKRENCKYFVKTKFLSHNSTHYTST